VRSGPRNGVGTTNTRHSVLLTKAYSTAVDHLHEQGHSVVSSGSLVGLLYLLMDEAIR
jgi:hypothetical protein